MADETDEFAQARGVSRIEDPGSLQIPWSETIVVARARHMDTKWALGRKAQDPVNQNQMRGLMEMQDAAGEDYIRKRTAALREGATAEEKTAALEAAAKLKMFVDQAQGARSTAGRTLNILQSYREGTSDEARAAIKFMKRMGGEENVDITLKLLEQMDPHQMMAGVDDMMAATTPQKLIEAWKMGLLSGPTTHAVNTISNKIFKSWDTFEHGIAGVLGKLHGGEKVYLREAPHRAMAGLKATKKALQVAAKAFDLEQEGFALDKLEMGRRKAIGGRKGRWIRAPGRALVAEDEFFKTLAAAAELESQAIRRVLGNPRYKNASRSEQRRAIDALIEVPDDAMKEAAEKTAHRLTYTTEVGEHGRRFQRYLQRHEPAQFVIPFFRTPVNIAKEAIKRTPAAPFLKEVRADLAGKNGLVARDLARARIASGGMIAGAVTMLADQGLITGAGPHEPGRRQAKFETWQPYSIRVGDRWISYNRVEPMGMLLGMAADAVELWKNHEGQDFNQMAGSLLMIPARNLASKTFIKGLADVMTAVTDPRRGAGKYLEAVSRSVVPGTALMGQAARQLDPARREVTNPLEAVMSQIPGARSTLPPGRTVTGKVAPMGSIGPDIISPFYQTKVSDDPVARELGFLADQNDEYGQPIFTLGKPSRTIDHIKVSQEEWQILWGDANERAADRLRRRISSESWQNRSPEIRAKQIKKIYNDERKRARQKIRRMRRQAAR
jgi:hypothetical protein